MTISDINHRLDKISLNAAANDHETAHALEDQLREEFLMHIAAGRDERRLITRKAALVLSSQNIKFHRYCS